MCRVAIRGASANDGWKRSQLKISTPTAEGRSGNAGGLTLEAFEGGVSGKIDGEETKVSQ